MNTWPDCVTALSDVAPVVPKLLREAPASCEAGIQNCCNLRVASAGLSVIQVAPAGRGAVVAEGPSVRGLNQYCPSGEGGGFASVEYLYLPGRYPHGVNVAAVRDLSACEASQIITSLKGDSDRMGKSAPGTRCRDGPGADH